MSRHFGFESNGKVCSCGFHHGIGDISPEQRAARCARMRDKLAPYMTPDQIAFLADWERYHGRVRYRMEVIGTNGGEFYKSHKGQDVWGAVFIDPNAMPATPDMFSGAA